MAIGARIRAFVNSPVGYPATLVLLAALCGATFGELGLIGAIFVLAFAFGLPIYFRWNTSLRKFLIVAIVVLVLGPVFTGVVVTENDLIPTGSISSTDNVLQNATVAPFQGTGAGTTFQFTLDVNTSTDLKAGLYLRAVSLWVTNCEGDSDVNGSRGKCWLSPADVWRNETQWVTSAQDNLTGSFPLTFTLSDLPTGQIFYFVLLTAVSHVEDAATVDWTYSCTGPSGSGSCGWVEGPITASWGGVYGIVAPGDYLGMALTVGVLVAVILLYMYYKGKERERKAKAKAAAGGEAAPPAPEVRCPNCNAVVESGEKTCWKCKKPLTGSPGTPASKPLPGAPLSSSSPAEPPPSISPTDEGSEPPSS